MNTGKSPNRYLCVSFTASTTMHCTNLVLDDLHPMLLEVQASYTYNSKLLLPYQPSTKKDKNCG